MVGASLYTTSRLNAANPMSLLASVVVGERPVLAGIVVATRTISRTVRLVADVETTADAMANVGKTSLTSKPNSLTSQTRRTTWLNSKTRPPEVTKASASHDQVVSAVARLHRNNRAHR